MRYAQIDKCECCNGNNIGVSIFTQGCPYHCMGCHNSSIWNYDGGKEFTTEDQQKILELIKPGWVTRFSILGGEPLIPQNVRDIMTLIGAIRKAKPEIKIWLWTGAKFEDLRRIGARFKTFRIHDNELLNLNWSASDAEDLNWILSNVDYVVDGRYVESLRDITLKFRGSSNQRIIDVRKTSRLGDVVEADEFN